MRVAQPYQVTLFLMLFKQLAASNFSFVPRKKCLDTIAQLGITIQQAKSEIMSLTYKDYHRGPEPDADTTGGEVWTFGKMINGQEIYIKLKAVTHLNLAKCLSFHVAERLMAYPYRRGKSE